MSEGELDEKRVFTITAVGVAVVGLIHPGSSDALEARPHLAELTPPPPIPASWVLWGSWPAGWGRAGPSLLLPFHLSEFPTLKTLARSP